MSNGPRARIAESVTIDIARPRDRALILEDENYYKIRNYLVNFLVSRSGELSGKSPEINEMPKIVNPAKQIFESQVGSQSQQPTSEPASIASAS